MKNFTLFIYVCIVSVFFGGFKAAAGVNQKSPSQKKPFRRALIISGGGIVPGIGVGVIAGAQDMGWVPDVIITACGSSLPAAVMNSLGDTSQTLVFMKGPRFFNLLQGVNLDLTDLFDLKAKFDFARNSRTIQNLFRENVLTFDESISAFLPNPHFRRRGNLPRFIIQAAKANFGPQNVGAPRSSDLFSQVYFTDSETSQILKNFKSPVKRIFPESHVSLDTIVMTDKTTEQAARASISDPFLINPAKINGEYYFTGAVDLFPVELGTALADEVLMTYPDGLYNEYENIVIQSSFGFNQSKRALHAIQRTDLKWIDMDGIEDLRFDPGPSYLRLRMENHIPTNPQEYALRIQRQYDFAYERVQEALRVQKDQTNVLSHLRRPINPRLFHEFTCQNANEWSTPRNNFCREDYWPGCSRQEPGCTPIR